MNRHKFYLDSHPFSSSLIKLHTITSRRGILAHLEHVGRETEGFQEAVAKLDFKILVFSLENWVQSVGEG